MLTTQPLIKINTEIGHSNVEFLMIKVWINYTGNNHKSRELDFFNNFNKLCTTAALCVLYITKNGKIGVGGQEI